MTPAKRCFWNLKQTANRFEANLKHIWFPCETNLRWISNKVEVTLKTIRSFKAKLNVNGKQIKKKNE